MQQILQGAARLLFDRDPKRHSRWGVLTWLVHRLQMRPFVMASKR